MPLSTNFDGADAPVTRGLCPSNLFWMQNGPDFSFLYEAWLNFVDYIIYILLCQQMIYLVFRYFNYDIDELIIRIEPWTPRTREPWNSFPLEIHRTK